MHHSAGTETLVREQVVRSTSTLEQSLHSPDEDRVHFHWKVDLADALDARSTEAFAFNGVRPDGRSTWEARGSAAARGATTELASNRAHFYVWAPKVGSLKRDATWKPWPAYAKYSIGNIAAATLTSIPHSEGCHCRLDYAVMGKWVDDLWMRGKLDHDAYGELALRLRRGYATRKRDLEAVLAEERSRRLADRVEEVDRALDLRKKPFRSFPQVRTWEESFLQVDFRYKVLVLCADSASGKSVFAESLFRNPYVLTVESSAHLDLKSFNYEEAEYRARISTFV